MIDEKIKTDILFTLYRAWLTGPSSALAVPELAHELSLEVEVVKQHCRFLSQEEFVHRLSQLGDKAKPDTYSLRCWGIDEAEELLNESPKPEDREIVRRNEAIRKALLEVIDELREEHPSPHGSRMQMSPEFKVDFDRKIEEKQLDKQSAKRNFSYLLASHHITLDSRFPGEDFRYEISPSGHGLLKNYAAREKQAAEHHARIANFEALKSGLGMTPQARGHALESLLKTILESEGWHCEQNVRTPSQENDLIIHKEREYIIIECKWEEATKASPEYISRLRDKVLDRPGFTTGILISMSGFTEGVVDSIKNRLPSCMILLFSAEDIEDVVYGRRKFTDILDERFHAAMSRTEIIVPGRKDATPKGRTKKAPSKHSAE